MALDAERHSKALEIELISDPEEKARQEAKNGLRQFDEVIELIIGCSPNGHSDFASPQYYPFTAAHWRGLEQMCNYINDNWAKASPLHLAAYTLWRMNWIHPFVDGNGRTSRAVSYLVLSVRLGYVLPGTITIPEQIAKNKDPYYQALEAADNANASGKPDLTEMEGLLESLLANQLVSVLDSARSRT